MGRLLSSLRAVFAQGARIDDLVGINRRNVDLVYRHNRREDYPLVDDKLRCKALLEAAGVPVARTLAVCEGLFAVPRVFDQIVGASDIVIKPASASGGDGIVVLGERGDGGWTSASGRFIPDDDVQRHLANIVFGAFSKAMDDRAFVEERIHAADPFASWSPDGLCDVRLLVLQGEPLMAMIRIPTRESGGRANLHQGGVGVAVDLATGCTTRAVAGGVAIDRHPDTGAALLGCTIPDWAQAVDVGLRAAACVPLGYLGVDLVFDEARGPLLLEMNARPGLEIQNVTGQLLGPLVARVRR